MRAAVSSAGGEPGFEKSAGLEAGSAHLHAALGCEEEMQGRGRIKENI
jgi:hypothetical protein